MKKVPVIPTKPVESSAIKAIGHDPVTNTLRVEFQSGGVYDYHGVPAEKHSNFIGAESIGKHFLQHIRGAHEYTRIR